MKRPKHAIPGLRSSLYRPLGEADRPRVVDSRRRKASASSGTSPILSLSGGISMRMTLMR